MSLRQRLLLPLLLALALTGCDQATKGWAREALAKGPTTLVAGVLDLRHTENPDVAFSLFRSLSPDVRRPLVIGLQSCAAVLLLWLLATRGPRSRLGAYAAATLAAGALGNIIDRLWRGTVTDFVHIHGWPIFNAADVFILVGGVLLGVAMLGERRRDPPAAAA